MRQITKAAAAAAGLALLLSACSSGDSTSTESSAPESSAPAASGDLLIWADNSANMAKTLEPLCTAWAEENGVTCTVKKFAALGDIRDQVIKANQSGDVPDLFVGPHDWLGELTKNGVVAPVDISAQAANFVDSAVQGAAYGGQNYGVPIFTENLGLLTNKSLSPECPATLDEAADLGEQMVKDKEATLGIAVQIGENGDVYHWYPLYSADGGYLFGTNADGSLNPEDLGVGQQGSIDAAKRLQDLADRGVVKASVSYDIARETFAKGKAPFFITGPWQLDEQSTALGDDLMVCPIPNWDGSSFQSQPFVGIQMFFQTQKAPNPLLASTFLNDEVMTTEFMDGMYSVDPRIPAWKESLATASSDPFVKAFGDYGATGFPMPAIPAMSAIWGDLGLAEYKVAKGDDPEKTMVAAGEAIQKTIAEQG